MNRILMRICSVSGLKILSGTSENCLKGRYNKVVKVLYLFGQIFVQRGLLFSKTIEAYVAVLSLKKISCWSSIPGILCAQVVYDYWNNPLILSFFRAYKSGDNKP